MSKQEEQQRQPYSHICKQHLFALDVYLNKNFKKVAELGPAVVIATPEVLYGRHITKRPINYKAVKLVKEANREGQVTTVFEDPCIF